LAQQIASELQLRADAIVTIKNGVSVQLKTPTPADRAAARLALGLSADCVAAGSVGELSPVKNLEMALEAIASARARVPRLAMAFIGDGACRPRLIERVRQLGIHDAVVFAGLRRNVPELLPALDVYLCSSNYEGISLSILEAMASGRAIIATEVGGNPELIQPGISGSLVPKGDARAMADELARLAGDESLRSDLGAGAQLLVASKHSVDQMVSRYESCYRQCRREPRSTARIGTEPVGPSVR
jgi:glycosyltransferase involved in cell wall biosynthesis